MTYCCGILVRDGLLIAGTKVVLPRGYDFSVSLLGKAATWVLYVGIGLLLVTNPSREWPLWVFYIGLGEQYEEEKLEAYPPGAVVVLPGGTRHFHWAKSGEYVTQVTALGPISLEYVDATDDP